MLKCGHFRFRYRNFRTFTSPRPVQFSCLAIDSTNEFVAAGAQDVFEIYVWSMKMGHLLEVSLKLKIETFLLNKFIFI